MIRISWRRAAAGAAVLWLGITALNLALMPARHMPRVKTEVAAPAPLDLILRAPGTLQPERNATVKAAFSGPVVRKLYEEGRRVEEGALLLEIGRDSIEADHLTKSNEVLNSQLELKKAAAELEVQEALFAKMAVSRSSVEDARRELQRARQSVEVSRAYAREAQERWKKNLVRAPISGTVTRDFVGTKTAVQADGDLASIGDLSSYTMEVLVDELDIGRVSAGQQAVISLQAVEAPLAAEVARIGSRTDEKALPRYRVILKAAETGGLPKLPQFLGEARILTGRTGPVLSVPLSAIASREGRREVWVVDSWGRVQPFAVELGRSNPDRVEVVNGLSAGARVVSKAVPFLRAGMKVRLDE